MSSGHALLRDFWGASRSAEVVPRAASALSTRARTAAPAVILGLLATALSVTGSWIPSLWGDEAASVLSASRSVPSLLSMIQHVDAVHATYYLGLHGWVQLFGPSPFSVRFPSAIAVGLCVAGVVLLGARLRSMTFGVVAGAICAVLPRITYVGEEARSYAFTAAIATWLTLVFVLIVQSGSRRRLWVVYAVLLTLGTYLFLYLALVAVSHLVVLLLLPRGRRRALIVPWVVASGAAVLATAPVIVLAAFERGQIAYLSNEEQVTPTSTLVSMWFGSTGFAVVGWTLLAAGIAAMVLDWRARRDPLVPGDATPPVATVVAAWMLVPSVLLIGTSPVLEGFTARYLAMCAPAVALLMAAGLLWLVELLRLRRPAVVTLITGVGVIAVAAVAAPVWAEQRGPYAKNDSDWVQISSTVGALARPGDAIAFDDGVRPSRRPRLALHLYPKGFTGLRDVTLTVPYYRSDTWYDRTQSLAAAAAAGRLDGVQRVWLVEYAIGSHVDHYGESTLTSLGFTPVHTTRTHRAAIIEYTRAPSP